MRIAETFDVSQPRDRLYAALGRTEAYPKTLELSSGPIRLVFESTFAVEELEPGERLRLRGHGIAPRLAFTLDAELKLREGAVDVEGELGVSGALAGLGQRELRHQGRRLLASRLAPK